MEPSRIRNFVITAHIDHGKSTLADRMLELTGTVSQRELKEQTLDSMDLERERGITIKLAPVRMRWKGYTLHLIDTPGHVDFTYEVSRSLAAVEGAVLLVDATQGVQAQTIANLYLALAEDLTIIPAVNKIDLPNADVARTRQELVELIGCASEEVLLVSGKTGEGVSELLDAIVERVPAPESRAEGEIDQRDAMRRAGTRSGPNGTEVPRGSTAGKPEPEGSVARASAESTPQRREASAAGAAAQGASTARTLAISPLRAIVFDSVYDDYRGVVAYVRIADGTVRRGDRLVLMATGGAVDALEVGTFAPKRSPLDALGFGEIGYIVTGAKDIRSVRVGDTVTTRSSCVSGVTASQRDGMRSAGARSGESRSGTTTSSTAAKREPGGLTAREAGFARSQGSQQPARCEAVEPLPGYAEVKPMVFAGCFPVHADEAERLREAIEKLRLNDAALLFEPERSAALGVGFRCGFLGLLHLDVVQERLRREHGIEVVVTVPSVAYRVTGTRERRRETWVVRSPQELPDPSSITVIEEPWVRLDVVTPERFVGALMQLGQERRGTYITTEYLAGGSTGDRRAILRYELPLAAILVDFYDELKSRSQGYASMNHEPIGYRPAAVRRLDVLVGGEPVEALASMVYEEDAMRVGRRIVERLKEAIPRQQFEVRLQAAIGGKIVAAERIPPLRKDVLAKMSGGDVTRKMKLLQKQRKGKREMRTGGHVEIPPSAYLAVLKR